VVENSFQSLTPHGIFEERQIASQNITLILPAYNEEMSIGSVVLLASSYADRVIVIDDGSSDRTAEVAASAGAEVVVHSVNMGKGMAFKTGFAAAEGADIIVTMDSDGQHNPADIPKLVAPILKGEADMVNGSRYLDGCITGTPTYRRIGQTILDRATVLNSGVKITDSQSGFRAFSASIKDVFRFTANGMAIESEMLADAGRYKLRVKEVPIGVRYDIGSSTENPIKHGLTVLYRVFKDMEYNKPLYYFTLPGFVFGAIGLYMGLTFLRTFYLGGGLNFGPTMLMILLTLVGVFMSFTGIILHSISRLIMNLK
jgi:glycosyltransferase involved in cell wall biosynthesis